MDTTQETKQQRLTRLSLERLDVITPQFNAQTGGFLQRGSELEVYAADAERRQLDYDAINRAGQQVVPNLAKFKTEGAAFVVIGQDWITIGSVPDRFFTPDDLAGVHDSTRSIRREIVLDHKGVSPSQSVKDEMAIMQFSETYVAAHYPGSRLSFDPKYVGEGDAEQIWNLRTIVKFLKDKEKIPYFARIETAEDLARHGYRIVDSVPGNASQGNFSVFTPEGKNLIFDYSGEKKASQLGLQMMAGFLFGMEQSAFPMNQTHSSFQRLSRRSDDPVIRGMDNAQARPEFIKSGDLKFEGASVKFSPYTDAGNQAIASMAGQRGASYLEERKADGSNFRLETRVGDLSGNRAFQVLFETASMIDGTERYKDTPAAELEKMLAEQAARKVPLPKSLGDSVELLVRNRDYFVKLVGEEIYEAALDVAHENLKIPAKGNNGLVEYLMNPIYQIKDAITVHVVAPLKNLFAGLRKEILPTGRETTADALESIATFAPTLKDKITIDDFTANPKNVDTPASHKLFVMKAELSDKVTGELRDALVYQLERASGFKAAGYKPQTSLEVEFTSPHFIIGNANLLTDYPRYCANRVIANEGRINGLLDALAGNSEITAEDAARLTAAEGGKRERSREALVARQ